MPKSERTSKTKRAESSHAKHQPHRLDMAGFTPGPDRVASKKQINQSKRFHEYNQMPKIRILPIGTDREFIRETDIMLDDNNYNWVDKLDFRERIMFNWNTTSLSDAQISTMRTTKHTKPTTPPDCYISSEKHNGSIIPVASCVIKLFGVRNNFKHTTMIGGSRYKLVSKLSVKTDKLIHKWELTDSLLHDKTLGSYKHVQL